MPVRYQLSGTTAAGISASVELGVRRGALAPGESLPPIRELAGRLGVSPATVAAAYRTLRMRGIVSSAGRNGTRVRPGSTAAPSRADRRMPVPSGVLDLSAGEPDPARLPAPAPALRRLAGAIAEPISYGGAGPVPELIDLAGQRLRADRVPTGGLTVTGGALNGIELLLGTHLRPGDRVGIEDPGWANAIDLVAALGLEGVAVPVDDEGPTPGGVAAALSSGVGALIVTSRAQNPTGAALSAARAATLRRLLHGYPGVLVIEDDHAAELSGVPLHPLAGAGSRWAFLRSVSKPYGPDLRFAALAGDPTTVSRVEGRQRLGAGWVSTILQRLVVDFWRDEAVAETVARAGREYDELRAGLLAALADRGVPAHGRTGLNVWIPVPDETAVVTRLRDAGYAVAPGSLCRIASPPGIRVTVAPLRPAGIPALADAIHRAISGPGPRGLPT